jgi:hypothetical protein
MEQAENALSQVFSIRPGGDLANRLLITDERCRLTLASHVRGRGFLPSWRCRNAAQFMVAVTGFAGILAVEESSRLLRPRIS